MSLPHETVLPHIGALSSSPQFLPVSVSSSSFETIIASSNISHRSLLSDKIKYNPYIVLLSADNAASLVILLPRIFPLFMCINIIHVYKYYLKSGLYFLIIASPTFMPSIAADVMPPAYTPSPGVYTRDVALKGFISFYAKRRRCACLHTGQNCIFSVKTMYQMTKMFHSKLERLLHVSVHQSHSALQRRCFPLYRS